MKRIFALAVLVLCFGVGSAQAQRGGGSVGGGGVGGGGISGGGSSSLASSSTAGGSGGGAVAIPGVTHHPLWVPPPNVSARNDGRFEPSNFESYDKAVAMGQEQLNAKQLTLAEIAKMSREQKATAEKAHIVVQQDVAGRMQEIRQ